MLPAQVSVTTTTQVEMLENELCDASRAWQPAVHHQFAPLQRKRRRRTPTAICIKDGWRPAVHGHPKCTCAVLIYQL